MRKFLLKIKVKDINVTNKVYIFYFSSFFCPKFNSVKELFLFQPIKIQLDFIGLYFFSLKFKIISGRMIKWKS